MFPFGGEFRDFTAQGRRKFQRIKRDAGRQQCDALLRLDAVRDGMRMRSVAAVGVTIQRAEQVTSGPVIPAVGLGLRDTARRFSRARDIVPRASARKSSASCLVIAIVAIYHPAT